MVELICVFSLFVDGLFKKKFDTIFMRNIKSCKKNHKKVLKIFFKPMPLEYPLSFSIN